MVGATLMKHYIFNGQIFAFELDGSQDYLIVEGMIPITIEERDALLSPLAHEPTTAIIDQINAIEATVTPRRIREAVLGIDNGWLADIDSQIAELRAQL